MMRSMHRTGRGARQAVGLSLVGSLVAIATALGLAAPAGAQTVSDPNLGVRTAASGLTTPIGIAFLGPDDFLVLEKDTGLVKRVVGGAVRGTVLDLPVNDAVGFFAAGEARTPAAHAVLQRMADVGLGYLRLGQPLTTLSGGERQRLKLATHMGADGGVYVLDEPTTGLHLADLQHLLGMLDRLVDTGNTVLVIEHNLDVIKVADHVIDLGPEGGGGGGDIIAAGTPEAVAAEPRSYTGRFLRTVLGEKSRTQKPEFRSSSARASL